MFVQVEPHAPAGFHIWLSERHPGDGRGEGWDIWADSAEDVDEWFAGELSSVTWSPVDGG